MGSSMTGAQIFWLIFIGILFLDLDLTAIVYGNRLVSLIGLIVLFFMILFVVAYVLRGV